MIEDQVRGLLQRGMAARLRTGLGQQLPLGAGVECFRYAPMSGP